jgi:hypothetical protein
MDSVKSLFYVRGIMRQTGLKESITLIARNIHEAVLYASTIADHIEFEREVPLGKIGNGH